MEAHKRDIRGWRGSNSCRNTEKSQSEFFHQEF
jgi:hypothetical protein